MAIPEALKKYIFSYVKDNYLDEKLLSEVPKKWEKYGDFILFDERTFFAEIWKSQNNLFWKGVADVLRCKRIGIKNKIKSDGFRTPNVTIVFGDDPWVVHKDNSIIYTWNVEKSMFSAGNACERHRMGKLGCENEVVVDLFAGIGYFTLPLLVHSKVAFVHACEWNSYAVDALKQNLRLNKVENKCKIYEGDNQMLCPKKVGNRIILGLIPTSENHWKIACEALVECGGVLHIHENVETKIIDVHCKKCSNLCSQVNFEDFKRSIYMDSNINSISQGTLKINFKHKQWLLKGVHIIHNLMSILLSFGCSKLWKCSLENINFVKSYAPHVHHLVYDVKIENKMCL